MNTSTEVYKIAVKLLEQHSTAAKALKPFVQQLRRRDTLLLQVALEYLEAIGGAKTTAKPSEEPRPEEPKPGDDPRPAEEPKPTQAEGSVKVNPFNVPGYRRRTHQEKQIALMARERMADAVYEARFVRGKPIGDLAWGELRSLVDGESIHAASYLLEGKEATARAILLTKIAAYAEVDDMKRKVRDVVPPNKIRDMIEQADAEAPVFIETFMHRYAASLKTGQIEQE